MAVANFEELCAGFCEIAGLKAPVLKPDQRGLLAFHTIFHGVTVDVMHWPDFSAEKALVLFDFGPIPEQGEARRLRAMLKANFLPFKEPAATFGCNPATGDLVLQYSLSLFDATAHTLLELVEEGASKAIRWIEHCGLKSRRAQTEEV